MEEMHAIGTFASLLCGDMGGFRPHPQPYAMENQGRKNPFLPHN